MRTTTFEAGDLITPQRWYAGTFGIEEAPTLVLEVVTGGYRVLFPEGSIEHMTAEFAMETYELLRR